MARRHEDWSVRLVEDLRDPGRPYEFKDAETLIDDFFDEVERVLRDRGIGLQVTRTSRRSTLRQRRLTQAIFASGRNSQADASRV
jgi:hypothetical protein